MTFYTMTSGAEANPAWALMDWVGAKLVECGWESMGTLMDDTTITGTTTNSGSTTYITDNTKSWVASEHVGKYVWITSGTAATTTRRQITANSSTQITIGNSWPNGTPPSGSGYSIETPRTAVYKSPSPANGLPSDFFVTLYASASVPSVTLIGAALHEQFDPVTKTRDKFAPIGGSTGLSINSDFSLATTKMATAANLPFGINQVGGAAGATWVLHVSPDRFILGRTNVAATQPGVFYIGAFDSFLAPSLDPMPLVNSTFVSGGMMTTRDPGISVASASNCEFYLGGSSSAAANFYYNSAVNGLLDRSTNASTNPFTGVSVGSGAQRIVLRTVRNFAFVRGLFKDILITAAGTLPGQTMDVNFGGGVVKQYVLVSSTGSGTSSTLNVWVRNSGD